MSYVSHGCFLVSDAGSMETKFVDTFEGVVSVKQNVVKSKNALASIGVQSRAAGVKERDAQTDVGINVSSQTSDEFATTMTVDVNEDVNYNWHTLNDFLLRSEPLILRTIANNRRTARLFAAYSALSEAGERDANVVMEYSLKSVGDWPEGAQALSVCWNSSGTTVGVACGHLSHEDWCTHRGFVMTWNIDRVRLNPNKADHVYEMGSCCTSLAFHPGLPNLFVTSSYTGDLLVWSLAEESDSLATAQTDDQGPISSVAWLPASSSADALSFASGGSNGRVLIWSIPTKGKTLTLAKAFQLTVADLPRSVRGKVGGENKGTGIASVSFAPPPLLSRFAVGTETGGVFQCSTDTSANPVSQITVTGARGSMACYDPVILTQKPYTGPVYKISFHPRQATTIGSCGSDGVLRIGTAFQTLPALEIDTGSGNLFDFTWSPSRPCVMAAASSAGRLLIFDLTQATDGPILSIDTTSSDTNRSLLAVAFNTRRANMLATGDASGNVKVWNLGDAFLSTQGAEEALLEELLADSRLAEDDEK